MKAYPYQGILTTRLDIRPARADDYEAWRAGYAERKRKTYKYDPGPIPPRKLARAEFRKRISYFLKRAREDELYVYSVFDRNSGEHLGVIDIAIFVRHELQWANLGYQIHNQHFGEGYGKEAAKAACIIAFKQLKLQRLEAAINLDNRPSIRVARAIGMKKECVRKRFYYENGQWTDHVVYVATRQTFV